MALVIPGGFGQVLHSLRAVNDPEPMAVTYGIGAEVGEFDAQEVVDFLAQAFVDNIMPAMATTYSLVSTELRFVATTGDAPSISVSLVTAVGGQNETVVPQNTAYLVDKRSGLAGRRGRGRFFLPGVTEGAVNNIGALIPSDIRTLLRDGLVAFLGDINAGPGIAGMFLLHSTGESAVPLPTPVTQLVLQDLVATQRQRLRR